MCHADAIRVLAELGANVNTPKNYDCTPVVIAAQNGQLQAKHALKEFGAKGRFGCVIS